MTRLGQSLVFYSVVVAHAWAQGTTLTTSSASTCDKCTLEFPEGISLRWSSFSPTETIVHATVRYIVNNATNSTTTTTIFNTLPAGVDAPPTNDAGTRVVTLTSFAATGGTTVVAYPTKWADYDSLVPWRGTISTRSSCLTAEDATITLPPHPPVASSLLYGNSSISTDEADHTGYFYSPYIEKWMAPIESIGEEIDERVLTVCDRSFELPPTALQGIFFLTETETSFQSSQPSRSTPEPTSAPPPPPTSNPPQPTSAPPQPSNNPPQPPQSSGTTPIPVENPSEDPATIPPAPPQTTNRPGNEPPSNPTDEPAPTDNPNPNPDSPTEQPPPTSAPVLTIGDEPITAAPGGSTFVVGSQTLTPGGTITISGTTVELNPTAPVVVINGESSTISSVLVTPTASTTGKQTTTTGEESPEFTGAASRDSKARGLGAVLVVGGAFMQMML